MMTDIADAIDATIAEIERLRTEKQSTPKLDLAAFAAEVVAVAWEGGCLDGGEIQAMAEGHGLIVATTYDPKTHGSSSICEAGDEWFVYSDAFKAAITPPDDQA